MAKLFNMAQTFFAFTFVTVENDKMLVISYIVNFWLIEFIYNFLNYNPVKSIISNNWNLNSC